LVAIHTLAYRKLYSLLPARGFLIAARCQLQSILILTIPLALVVDTLVLHDLATSISCANRIT
jgi:hypothetical protein